MNLRRQAFFLICLLLVVYVAGASYHRFVVEGDYTVEYEGECDPATESCFVGCEDEECAEVYYYSWIQKHASDVEASCGTDITDCETAGLCLPTDTECEVTYCSPETVSEDETCEDQEGSIGLEDEEEEIDETETMPL